MPWALKSLTEFASYFLWHYFCCIFVAVVVAAFHFAFVRIA